MMQWYCGTVVQGQEIERPGGRVHTLRGCVRKIYREGVLLGYIERVG